jgi:hypothetical protein
MKQNSFIVFLVFSLLSACDNAPTTQSYIDHVGANGKRKRFDGSAKDRVIPSELRSAALVALSFIDFPSGEVSGGLLFRCSQGDRGGCGVEVFTATLRQGDFLSTNASRVLSLAISVDGQTASVRRNALLKSNLNLRTGEPYVNQRDTMLALSYLLSIGRLGEEFLVENYRVDHATRDVLVTRFPTTAGGHITVRIRGDDICIFPGT